MATSGIQNKQRFEGKLMKINLAGKTALICASTKGLGFACAKNLASTGCDIILTGRFDDNLMAQKRN